MDTQMMEATTRAPWRCRTRAAAATSSIAISGPTTKSQAAMLALARLSDARRVDRRDRPAVRSDGPRRSRCRARRRGRSAARNWRRSRPRTACSNHYIGQGYYGTSRPESSCATYFRTPRGTPPIRRTSRRSRRAGSKRWLNFQTMVCDLTGMAIANASMLDEATAAAEAMTLCQRAGKSASTTIYVADDVLPQTIDVVRTRARPLGIGRRRRTRDATQPVQIALPCWCNIRARVATCATMACLRAGCTSEARS